MNGFVETLPPPSAMGMLGLKPNVLGASNDNKPEAPVPSQAAPALDQGAGDAGLPSGLSGAAPATSPATEAQNVAAQAVDPADAAGNSALGAARDRQKEEDETFAQEVQAAQQASLQMLARAQGEQERSSVMDLLRRVWELLRRLMAKFGMLFKAGDKDRQNDRQKDGQEEAQAQGGRGGQGDPAPTQASPLTQQSLVEQSTGNAPTPVAQQVKTNSYEKEIETNFKELDAELKKLETHLDAQQIAALNFLVQPVLNQIKAGLGNNDYPRIVNEYVSTISEHEKAVNFSRSRLLGERAQAVQNFNKLQADPGAKRVMERSDTEVVEQIRSRVQHQGLGQVSAEERAIYHLQAAIDTHEGHIARLRHSAMLMLATAEESGADLGSLLSNTVQAYLGPAWKDEIGKYRQNENREALFAKYLDLVKATPPAPVVPVEAEDPAAEVKAAVEGASVVVAKTGESPVPESQDAPGDKSLVEPLPVVSPVQAEVAQPRESIMQDRARKVSASYAPAPGEAEAEPMSAYADDDSDSPPPPVPSTSG